MVLFAIHEMVLYTKVTRLKIDFVFVRRFDLLRSSAFVSCFISVLEFKLLISSSPEVSVSNLFPTSSLPPGSGFWYNLELPYRL